MRHFSSMVFAGVAVRSWPAGAAICAVVHYLVADSCAVFVELHGGVVKVEKWSTYGMTTDYTKMLNP